MKHLGPFRPRSSRPTSASLLARRRPRLCWCGWLGVAQCDRRRRNPCPSRNARDRRYNRASSTLCGEHAQIFLIDASHAAVDSREPGPDRPQHRLAARVGVGDRQRVGCRRPETADRTATRRTAGGAAAIAQGRRLNFPRRRQPTQNISKCFDFNVELHSFARRQRAIRC